MGGSVLITGGAGFIGSYIADRLIAEGYRLRLLDNLHPQVHRHGHPPYLNHRAEMKIADVRDKAALAEAIKDIDIIIHCAAAVGVGQSMYRVRHYVDVNVQGTAALLEAIIERDQPLTKLIVFTSMTGYGEGLYRRPSDGKLLRVAIRSQPHIEQYGWDPICPETGEILEPVPTPEDSALLATNVYALTKRYQEELALTLGQTYQFPVVCLRLFNVYGPRQSLSNPYTGVLAIFLSRLLNNERPVVYEDGRQTRDFVSVHDVVRATLLAIEQPAADGQVFNVGTGVARQVGKIAQTLAQLLDKPDLMPHITHQFRTGDIRHCLADLSRTRKLLGFSPQVNWEDSLSELIEWAQSVSITDQFNQAYDELLHRGLVNARSNQL
jgi:dTDP-L-rhamnose 4-epimerase